MEDNHLISELMAEANRQANEVSDLLNRAAEALAQPAKAVDVQKVLEYDCPCVGLDGEHNLCLKYPVQQAISNEQVVDVKSIQEVIDCLHYPTTHNKTDGELADQLTNAINVKA